MARNGMALAGLWALGVLGCAEVTVDDPPSQLGGVPNAAAGMSSTPGNPSGVTPVSSIPGSVSPGAQPPVATGDDSSESNGQGRPIAGTAGTSGSSPPVSTPPIMAPPIAASGESGDVLFADDFEDGNDAGWVADVADGDDLVGNWEVVDTDEGRAYAQLDASSSDESWSVGGNINWTDVSFDVRFRFTDANSIEDAIVMLGARFQDKDNYYFIEYRGEGSLKLRKRVDGSDPELFSEDLDAAAVAGEWIDVNFSARGSSLEVRVDGQVIGSAVVDTDLTSGGIALGVRENAAVEFDDVRVTVP